MSFILIPILIWWTTSYCVCLVGWFLVPFSYSVASLSCVTIDDIFPRNQEYPFGSSFGKYLFLLNYYFSWNFWGSCLIFPVPFCRRVAMVNVRFSSLCKYFVRRNQLGDQILSENAASTRFSSAEEKYCCSSSTLLACWKSDFVAFKCCYFLNVLYSNTRNVLKLAHVLSGIGFLLQSLHASV